MRALGAPRAYVLHARALSRRAALPHSTRPVPGPCSTVEPRTSSPPLHAISGALQRRGQSPWQHAGVGSEPLTWTAPPMPPQRASCPREQPGLIPKLVGTRSSPPRRPAATAPRSPAFFPRPPRDQPRAPIKGGPELLRALRRPQAFPLELPMQWIDRRRPSSPTSASSAAAELRCKTSQPATLSPNQRHQ